MTREHRRKRRAKPSGRQKARGLAFEMLEHRLLLAELDRKILG